ncbi:MAG: hypothetical protein FJY92_01275, partial [Candidatus Hydrogenedentes bacterium]|nr:hypothetical protein [Candidatus Hydrogenedentota bacterium]
RDEQDDRVPREGEYDAQLSFAVPFVEAPSPIAWILKRDGHEAPFERRKIADAIFNAARAIGGEDRDRAESLATGVTIYLAKHAAGAPPTVDQVHDAVERVLVEMGHGRTALAYARYRDKRARLRRLRAGDVTAILKELDEAREQRDAIAPLVQRPLFVRTSDERWSGWDRERIVEALVREACMPADEARRVALEVEAQVARADLTTLTAALVRELVDAKLVELGLERYRARHMRLGVPLYDTEQIICSPNQGEVEGQQDPAATDLALARRVKREFALAAVHSPEVTDAHVRGDIHLHGLSRIDRMQSAAHSLEFVRRFGLAVFPGSRYAPPPTTADALIAQASRFTAAMQRHFIEGARWRAFNESLSPMLHSGADMDRVARLALFGMTTPAGAPPVSIELRWRQANIASCMFAMQYADAWGAAVDDAGAFGLPHAVVAVDAESLGHADFRAWLESLLETRERRTRIAIAFDRGDETPSGLDWPARDVVGGTVTLNLPRAAYEAENEDALDDLVGERARVALDALAEKKSFLERLFAFGGAGPLAALAFRHNGAAYADPHHARYVLGVTGLDECVQATAQRHAADPRAAHELAQRVLDRVKQEANTYAAHGHMMVDVRGDDDAQCARRFAALDLQLHGDMARRAVARDSITRDATYTPGAGRFATDSPTALDADHRSPADLVRAIEELFRQTSATTVRFA